MASKLRLIMKKKKSAINQPIDSNLIIKGVLVVGGLYLAYKIVSTLLEGLGLKRSAEDVLKDNKFNASIQELSVVMTSALIKDLQSKNIKYLDLDATTAKQLRDNFHNLWSFGILDEKNLILLFTQLKSQTQVSVLSGWYEGYHGESLLQHINNHLSSLFLTQADQSAINDVFEYVKKLPLGVIK